MNDCKDNGRIRFDLFIQNMRVGRWRQILTSISQDFIISIVPQLAKLTDCEMQHRYVQ